MADQEGQGAVGVKAQMALNEAWQGHLEQALAGSGVALLAIGPGRGAVHFSKGLLGSGAREIDVAQIEGQAGPQGVASAFAQAASRGESVVVTGMGRGEGASEPGQQAAADGVRALAGAGGKAVVVAREDLSHLDFGASRFVGAMEPAPELSAALKERLQFRRLSEQEIEAVKSAAKGPGA